MRTCNYSKKIINSRLEIIPNITVTEVTKAVKKYEKKWSTGEDRISIYMIQRGGRKLVEIVAKLIYSCLKLKSSNKNS